MKALIRIERIPGPLASIYEKATRTVIKSYYAEVAEEILGNRHAGVILDLGTGPGYLPVEIAKRSPAVRVHGIDLGRKLIEMARNNALNAGLADRVTFQTANAARLPFSNHAYDGVISTGMLHMLRDPVKVLQECYRVLRPGGEAVFYDPAQVSNRMDRRTWEASLTRGEKMVYGLFVLYNRINPPHSYTLNDVVSMIQATDFQEYWIREQDKEIKVILKK